MRQRDRILIRAARARHELRPAHFSEWTAEYGIDANPGDVITDDTGSRYTVIEPYDTGRNLGSGEPDAGYRARAHGGSRVTSANQLYHVPFARIASVRGRRA